MFKGDALFSDSLTARSPLMLNLNPPASAFELQLYTTTPTPSLQSFCYVLITVYLSAIRDVSRDLSGVFKAFCECSRSSGYLDTTDVWPSSLSTLLVFISDSRGLGFRLG